MTDEGTPSATPTRRRFLAAAATGLAAATAGCGYVPGGGDLAWEASLRTGGLAFGSDRWYRAKPTRLVTVENQSGRTFDFEDEVWREVENAAVAALTPDGTHRGVGETDRQVAGAPAVAGDGAYLPVEGGRVTAVDLSAGRDDAADSAATTGSDDPVRWRVDAAARLGAASDGEGETSGGLPRAVRASDALAAAIGARGIAAFDADTGEEAFAVPELYADASGGEIPTDPTPRVAVDGETVWALVPEGATAGSDGEAAIVGYDRAGNRRAERRVAAAHEWLVAADGTVVVGGPEESMTGFGADLDRRFALDAAAPRTRPTEVVPGEGWICYSRGRTLAAVDVRTGEVAFERSDLPGGLFAADERGAYVAEPGGSPDDPPQMVAVAPDGSVRWEAPLPDGVAPERLFATGGRLVAVDDDTAHGFRATPGERWSPLR